MIDSRDEIDRLFRDKLSDYGEEAPPYMWEKIEDRLRQKRRIRMVRIWVALAASIALIVSMGVGYYFGQYRAKQQVADKYTYPESIMAVGSEQSSAETGQLSKMTKDGEVAVQQVAHEPVNRVTNYQPVALASPAEPVDSGAPVKEITTSASFPGYMNSRQGLCQQNSLYHTLLAERMIVEPEEKPKDSAHGQVFLAFTAAPLYAYRVVNGAQAATLDEFEKPAVTFSAGMHAIYASRRFQLSMGLYFTRMALRIDKVVLREVAQTYDSYGINTDQQSAALLNSSGTIQPTTRELIVSNTELVVAYQYPDQTLTQHGVDNFKASLMGENLRNMPGELTSLTQQFNYLEIPLNFQYNFYQRRITVGLQTGINANLLASNSTYAEIEDQQTKIGQTHHLRTFNLAAVMGISVAIPFTQRLSFLVEPRFRYYLLSVNRNMPLDTHPYSYGIYTGIRVRY